LRCPYLFQQEASDGTTWTRVSSRRMHAWPDRSCFEANILPLFQKKKVLKFRHNAAPSSWHSWVITNNKTFLSKVLPQKATRKQQTWRRSPNQSTIL
jgi:hypothetical protein